MNAKQLKEIMCCRIITRDIAIHDTPKITSRCNWKLNEITYQQYGYASEWFFRLVYIARSHEIKRTKNCMLNMDTSSTTMILSLLPPRDVRILSIAVLALKSGVHVLNTL
jgi:hypothetical protein